MSLKEDLIDLVRKIRSGEVTVIKSLDEQLLADLCAIKFNDDREIITNSISQLLHSLIAEEKMKS